MSPKDNGIVGAANPTNSVAGAESTTGATLIFLGFVAEDSDDWHSYDPECLCKNCSAHRRRDREAVVAAWFAEETDPDGEAHKDSCGCSKCVATRSWGPDAEGEAARFGVDLRESTTGGERSPRRPRRARREDLNLLALMEVGED